MVILELCSVWTARAEAAVQSRSLKLSKARMLPQLTFCDKNVKNVFIKHKPSFSFSFWTRVSKLNKHHQLKYINIALCQNFNLTDVQSRLIDGKRIYCCYKTASFWNFKTFTTSSQPKRHRCTVSKAARYLRLSKGWVTSATDKRQYTISYNEFSQKGTFQTSKARAEKTIHWTSEKDVVADCGMPLKNLWKKRWALHLW